MIARRIRVEGKVQGVFYRGSTKQKANELGLKGWVKNEPDGSVLIEVVGEQSSIHLLEKWCWEGPLLSNVTNLISEEAEVVNYPAFEVRY